MPSVSTCLRRSVSTWPSVTFPPSPSQVTGSRWKSPCRTVSEAPGPTASTCRPLGRANSPRRERWWSSTRVPLKGRNHGHKVNQISELWLWLWLITNICIYMHTHTYIYICMYVWQKYNHAKNDRKKNANLQQRFQSAPSDTAWPGPMSLRFTGT